MNDNNNKPIDNSEFREETNSAVLNSRKTNKIVLFLAFLLIAILVFGAIFIFNSLFSVTTEDAVVEGPSKTLTAKVNGRLAALNAEIGDEVKANQILAEIDTLNFENSLRQLEKKLADSKSKLSAMEKRVSECVSNVNSAIQKRNAAASKLAAAEKDYTKSAQMYKEGIISKQEYDNSLNSLTSYQGEAKFAEENLISAKSLLETNKQQLQVFENEIKAIEEEIKRAQSNLDNAKIYSPEDGKVLSVIAKTGDYVKAAQPVIEIAPNKIWVLATYSEKHFEIKPAQNVKIRIPDCKNKTFKGHVENVQRPTGAKSEGVLVKILIDDDSAAETISTGMQAVPTIKNINRWSNWVIILSTSFF